MLSQRWRTRLSLAAVKIAEALPPKCFPIADRLQRIGSERVERARKVVAAIEASPYSLKFLGFSLVELFPIELLDSVMSVATEMFPSFEPSDSFGVHSLGHTRLGSFYRSKPPHILIADRKFRLLPALPTWVERVDLSLSRIYDSTFIVVADVITTPVLDELFASHLRQLVPPAIELNRVHSISRLGYAYTQYSEHQAYSASADAFFQSLRSTVQRQVFRRFLPFGYFLSHRRRLPTIDILEIIGDASSDNDDWINATASWRNTLGIDFERDYYSSDGIAVDIPGGLPVQESPIWRIVVRPSYQVPEGLSREPIVDRERAVAIQTSLFKTFHTLAVIAHQGVVAALLADFRRQVFLAAAHRHMIVQQTALYEAISGESLLFARSRRELQDNASEEDDYFLKPLRYRTAFIPHLLSKNDADRELRETAIWGYARLATGIDEIRNHFSDVLAARNYGATFMLTAAAVIIAILSFVVSVVALKATQVTVPPTPPPVHSSRYASPVVTTSVVPLAG